MTDETALPAPANAEDVLERIDTAWREFMAALDSIPDDRMAESGAVGAWSLQDLFGHVAFWDEQAIVELERALAGQPRREIDWQAMNDAEYAARHDRTLPEQRTEMHQAHALLIERLEDISGLEAAPIDEAIKGATYEHYAEHIPDIRSWRARIGL